MNSITRTIRHNGTRVVEGQRIEPQNWSQFWPADSTAEMGGDALIQEAMTGLDQEGAIQDMEAGYRSESQGE